MHVKPYLLHSLMKGVSLKTICRSFLFIKPYAVFVKYSSHLYALQNDAHVMIKQYYIISTYIILSNVHNPMLN